jgi:hypothetical protein
MEKIIALAYSLLLVIVLSGCEVIGDIFGAGVYTGIFMVVFVVIVIIFIISKITRR